MVKKPELQIDSDADSHPVSAKCSACGVQMPHMQSKGASSVENKRWFAIQFDLHVRQKHSREDVNQPAARIVGEATERS
jgi:hypothetical protein